VLLRSITVVAGSDPGSLVRPGIKTADIFKFASTNAGPADKEPLAGISGSNGLPRNKTTVRIVIFPFSQRCGKGSNVRRFGGIEDILEANFLLMLYLPLEAYG
jgi:hypothetical protein